MAFPTVEQMDAVMEIEHEIGLPEQMAMEMTSAPYGLLVLSWKERRIYLRPDGSRLVWNSVSF